MSTASWLRKSGNHTSGRQARWWRRILVTVAVVGLLLVFAYVLFAPFWHPRTHLVLLTGAFPAGRTDLLGTPASEYVAEDFSEFLPLETVLYRGLVQQGPVILGNLQSQESMKLLGTQLERLSIGRRDVLIVYVSAEGISEEGTPYVLCSQFDAANPRAGRYPLRNLLQQVAASPAAVKLVVFEAGRRSYDPARGMLVNEFPRLLADEVRSLGDERLWVLCSHGLGEQSHVSLALHRSLFGYFVAKGLGGAADLNSDRAIDLGELHRFVRVQVGSWVEAASAGRMRQTPWIASVHEAAPARWPLLVGVVASDEQQAPDHRATIAAAQQPASSSADPVPGSAVAASYINQQISRVTPSGTLGMRLADLARAKVDRVTAGGGGATAPAGESQAPSAPAADAASEAKGSDEKGAAADSKEATGTPADSPAAAAAPGAPSGPSAADDAALRRMSAAALIAEAWRHRDELDAPSRTGPRPLDYAPHLWRRFQEQLVAYERANRIAPLSPQDSRLEVLRQTVADLRSLSSGEPSATARSRSLARGLTAWMPFGTNPYPAARSLAEAEVQAERLGRTLANPSQQWAQEYDRFATATDRKEFDTWLAALPAEAKSLHEIRDAQRFAAQPGLAWEVTRRGLRLARLAEQVATRSQSHRSWIGSLVTELNAARRELEQRAVDNLHVDPSDLNVELDMLTQRYEQCDEMLRQIAACTRLRNDVLFRARYYIDIYEAAHGRRDVLGFDMNELSKLLADLARFDKLLEGQEPQTYNELLKLSGELQNQRSSIEQCCAEEMVELLVAAPIEPGDTWRMDVLLRTPLPSSPARRMLVTTIDVADAEFFRLYDLPDTNDYPTLAPQSLAAGSLPRCAQLAELEGSLASLVADEHVGASDIAALESATQEFADELVTAQQASAGLDAAELWKSCARLDALLEDFHRNLPGRIMRTSALAADMTEPATRLLRYREALACWRGLFLVDGRAAASLEDPALTKTLDNARAYDWLVAQAERWQVARIDTSRSEAESLTSLANAYRAAATAIALQPPLPVLSGPSASIQVPTHFSLSIDQQQECAVTYQYEGTEQEDAWIVVDYDPRLLSVRSLGEYPVYRQFEIGAKESARGGSGDSQGRAKEWHSAILALRPSIRVVPGHQQSLTLILERLQGALFPTRLVVKLVTSRAIVRTESEVYLPAPEWAELAISGTPGSWTMNSSGASLHSFANRTTDYRLSLANRSTSERSVSIQLLALDSAPPRVLPQAALTADDAAMLLSEMSIGKTLAQVTPVLLPADGRPVEIPFPPPPEADPAAAPPPPLAGLLLVVREEATKQVILKHLEFKPQRPTRFLDPHVSYDPRRSRLEIEVVPLATELIPPEGVRVRAEVVEPLAPAAERRLDGVVQAPEFRTQLYAEVAPAAGRMLTVVLHVDDFPRAFVYHVSCDQQVRNVPVASDEQSIRIKNLPEGLVYRAPAGAIPVLAAVDVPFGAFEEGSDYIEVGLDRDRDRELIGEETVRLYADRKVTVNVALVAPKGQLRLDTKVGDLEVQLPDQSRQSGRANVLARLVSGGATTWSAPEEIILDGEPPTVTDIRVRPGEVVEIGKDLLLSLLADDDQLSGVGKVEAAFDITRSGKFPEGDGIVALTLDPDGRWSGKLPTKPLATGPYNLLIRATDVLGNASEPRRVPIQVEAAKDGTAAQQLVTISGTVVYGRQPQAGIKVSMRPEGTPAPTTGEGDPPAGVRSAVTDEQGRFQFAEVPAGKFVLTASGVVRNKPRSAETTVTAAPPSAVPPVQLKLP